MMNDSIQRLSEQQVKTLATGTTQSSSSRGSALTAYGLQPVMYLKSIVDAAQNQLFFTNFCNIVNLPTGAHQISIPKRKKYLGRDTGSDGVQISTTEPTSTDMTVTTIDNMDKVAAIPTPRYAGVAITNYNLRVNALNLLQWAKDELSYGIGDELDREVATTIGDATYTSDTVNGSQIIYGGDATGDSSLDSGDVITTDLVAKAARYLKQSQAYYYTGGTETLSSVTKNPWLPTSGEPFVLFIAPVQEETFRKDSQFVNAAEYGSDKVIRNGEIGEYLGIKIIVTNNVEQVASGGTSPDDAQTSGTTTTGASMTRCIMMKAKSACSVAWGQKPTLKVFDYPQRDQTWVTIVSAWRPVVVQSDAIVFMDVAD